MQSIHPCASFRKSSIALHYFRIRQCTTRALRSTAHKKKKIMAFFSSVTMLCYYTNFASVGKPRFRVYLGNHAVHDAHVRHQATLYVGWAIHGEICHQAVRHCYKGLFWPGQEPIDCRTRNKPREFPACRAGRWQGRGEGEGETRDRKCETGTRH